MRLTLVALILCTMLGIAAWHLKPASAEAPADYDIPNGHFFTQTNGAAAGVEPAGYAVTNEGGVRFWDEFRRLGSVGGLGYPISRRFTWDGFTVQAFQKGVLQWRPEVGRAWLVNVFDQMHMAGKDSWLLNVRSTPPPLPPEFDAGKPWATVQRDRQALLNANAAIKARYFAAADPLTFFGLPTSRVVDNGNHFAIRLQRAVIQQWKADMPWAKAGQVTVANGGSIAREAGLLPGEAVATELPPWGAGRVVAIDPGHGGAEIGAAYRFADGTVLLEKDINLRIALKLEALLARAGYKPVLTRRTDTEVNLPQKLVTQRLPIGLDDELQARIDIANNANAKLFLSIHFNGHNDSTLRGPEVYYCKERPFAGESRRFAELLLGNLVRGLASVGYKDPVGRLKEDSEALRPGEHFYVLGPGGGIITRPSQMPAALAEGLFVTNSGDASALRVESTLDAIARAYATAIHQYFAADNTAQLPLAPSPAPPPAPQPTVAPPKPALGQGTVAVEFGGGAMLRAQPNTGGAIVRSLPNGGVIDLLQLVEGEAVLAGDKRWYRARYDGSEGYVYGPLVQGGNSDPASPAPASLGTGTVATDFGGGAMLRAEPNTQAQVVRSVPDGAKIELLQAVSGEALVAGDKRWYRGRYDGSEGYIYALLVQVGSSSPAPTPVSLGTGTVAADFGGGAMLRAEPDRAAEVVRSVPDGATVELLRALDGEAVVAGDARWYRARYDGSEGYVYGKLVQLS